MTNLSQWFDLAEQMPWEVGVYEVQSKHQPGDIGMYSFFDGRIFKYIMRDANSAFEKRSLHTFAEIVRWRGLSTNPAAPKPSGNRKVTRYVVMRKSDPPAPVATYSGWIHAARKSNELTLSTPFRYYVVKIRHRTPEAT